MRRYTRSEETFRRTMRVPMLFVSFTACFFFAILTFAQMPPPAGYQLRWAGFPTDVASLTAYLREGLPAEPVTRPGIQGENQKSERDKLLRDWRWDLYRDCVGALRDSKAMDATAAYIVLIQNPLPKSMMDDLLLHVGSQWTTSAKWEDWDSLIAAETMTLRAAAGRALLDFDKQSAGETLAAFVEKEKPTMKAAMEHGRAGWGYVNSYASLCGSAMLAGRREGMDALMELLPLTHSQDDGGIPYMLSYYTGVEIPIAITMSDGEFADAVQKWQAWWAANRDSFTAAEPRPKPETKKIDRFETVRDYVDGATQFLSGGDYFYPAYPDAIKWLKEHGGEHFGELRKIADSEGENEKIREEAAHRFIRSGNKKAFRWAQKRLLTKSAGSNPAKLYPAGWLFNWLHESFPTKVDDIARECVKRGVPSSEAAVIQLLSDDNRNANAPFVFERYESIVKGFPQTRNRFAEYCLGQALPGDERVLADCIENGDQYTAEIAAAAVMARGNRDSLPDKARQALARREEDPIFRLDVLDRGPDKEFCRNEAARIVDAVSTADAHAAGVFMRAFRIFTYNPQKIWEPEAARCVAGLQRCIAAYRESRGLAGTRG